MTILLSTRHLLMVLAALSAMLLGACHDDGLLNPPADGGNDSCCAQIVVAVTGEGTAANTPLAGVEVALRKGSTIVATKETNADGIATFTNVCNAEYNLRLSRREYAVVEKTGINITSCDTTRVALAMSTARTGEQDSCCNSTLRIFPTSPEGSPLPGAEVKLIGPGGKVRMAVSTQEGAHFRELCEGAYSIRIARDGFKVHESRIELGCNVEVTERRALQRTEGHGDDSCCKARLVVGAKDAHTKEFLRGTVVKLSKGGHVVRTMTIGERPAVFEDLCKGDYLLSFSRDGYRAAEMRVAVQCDGINEVMRELEKISGGECCNNNAVIRVFDGTNRQPVANASVKLLRGGAVVASVKTNGDGAARFEKLCAGEYGAVVEREGYRPAELKLNVICERGGEATAVLMPKTTDPGDSCCNATLRLKVLDGGRDQGAGLMGVKVIIKLRDHAIGDGTTNREGYFERGQLCKGKVYAVVLEKEGYHRLVLEVPVERCEVIEKAVRMMPR